MGRHRSFFLSVAVLPVSIAACSNEPAPLVFQPVGAKARVRVVNVSASSVDVLINGFVAGSLVYGKGTGCLTVNSTTSGIAIRFPAKTVSFGSANGLDFIPGETANLFATAFDTVVMYQLIRVPVDTTATGGLAKLLVLNASGVGSYDVYVTGIGTALGSPSAVGLATGVVGVPFNMTPGQQQVRLAATGTQNIQIDVGNRQWLPDERQILIVAPPATIGSTVRTLFWNASGC